MNGDPETSLLAELLARARASWDAMTPQERGAMLTAQRRSWVRSIAGFGSDSDEAEFMRALAAEDQVKIDRLNAEAKERMERADKIMMEAGL